MKILITAFEPFGGRSCNTSADLLNAFRRNRTIVGSSSYRFAVLPVSFRRAWPVLRYHLAKNKPDGVLLLGEKGAGNLTLETIAKNKKISRVGLIPIGKSAREKLASPLPLRKIFTTLAKRKHFQNGFLSLSTDAGSYLCNFVYYKMLSAKKDIPAIFVHVRALTPVEFSKKKKKFYRGIGLVVRELAKAIDGAGPNYTSREN